MDIQDLQDKIGGFSSPKYPVYPAENLMNAELLLYGYTVILFT